MEDKNFDNFMTFDGLLWDLIKMIKIVWQLNYCPLE